MRVWFTLRSGSPTKPFTQERWIEQRYMALPPEALDPDPEPWSISTDAGETYEP